MLVNQLKQLVSKTINRVVFGHATSSDEYVKYLREKGVSVGEYVKFFGPRSNIIDVTRPYLLKIGKGVKITEGVAILTHDFSFSVFRKVYHSIQNECAGYTIIGDNCFIGIRSVILGGVHLGDNCIVAAGSVVTTSFPSGSVIGGNPAKLICTLDDLYKRRNDRQIEDAFRQANIIRKEYGREPLLSEMKNFYPLFLERKKNVLKKNEIFTKISGDDEDEIIADFYASAPVFNGFDDFLEKSKGHDIITLK